MNTDEVADALDQLTETELLSALNGTLARRRPPATEQEIAAQQARELDAEYDRYYPTQGGRS